MRGRNENLTSGTLHVEHMRMEMAKIFQEVDRLGGTRAGMEGEGTFGIAERYRHSVPRCQEVFDITAAAVGMVRDHISSRIPEMHLAKPTFRAVCA